MNNIDYTQFNTLKDFVNSALFLTWEKDHYRDIHPCWRCDIIQEEIGERIERYSQDLLHYTEFNHFIEDLREICDYCWCDKGQGKIWWFGGCDNLII